MNVWVQLGVTIGIILALMAAWLGVQALVRRELPPDAKERDVLACRGCAEHSCSGCSLSSEK